MLVAKRNMMGGGEKIPTAIDYPQEGLVSHLDGIENVGYGVHASGSGVPIDLIGTTIFNVCSFENDEIVATSWLSGGYSTAQDSAIITPFRNGEFSIFHCGSVERNVTAWRGRYYIRKHTTNNSTLTTIAYRIGDESVQIGGVNIANTEGGVKTATAIIIGDGKYRVYINGEKVGEGSYTAAGAGSVIDYRFGGCFNGSDGSRTNSMLIYNRAVSDAEVKKIYEIDKARFGLT